MTHEIEIIISHFSRLLKSLSVIFMAHGIYNTPTFRGSWTLVPDISWQFHEPWNPKPIINFSWKIHGLRNRPWTWNICIQGPERCFLGFLITFSWDFHNIAVHSESTYGLFSVPHPFNVRLRWSCMANSPLAIVTEGHLRNATRTAWRSLSMCVT